MIFLCVKLKGWIKTTFLSINVFYWVVTFSFECSITYLLVVQWEESGNESLSFYKTSDWHTATSFVWDWFQLNSNIFNLTKTKKQNLPQILSFLSFLFCYQENIFIKISIAGDMCPSNILNHVPTYPNSVPILVLHYYSKLYLDFILVFYSFVLHHNESRILRSFSNH